MSNVTIIPGVEKEKYCVGIYARVSSTKVEQLRSMSNQVNGLIQVINNNPKWVLTDVFMDYKSGMTTKREEFNRMIDMCKAKQLDIIITKSVSRFGRNTIDVLTTLQTLVDLVIRIYFEAEQMWSDDPSTRVYITVATAVAEGKYDRGILICGTGIGVCIAANKVPGAYAALVNNVYQAQRASLSNNANIITMGAQVTGIEVAKMMVDEYLSCTFDPQSRSMPKVQRIYDYEKEGK
jgi:ribose 5-phosphate isomerase B